MEWFELAAVICRFRAERRALTRGIRYWNRRGTTETVTS